MITIHNKFIALTILSMLLCSLAKGQSYVDKMLSHQVTIHSTEHTVIAHVKPVKAGKVISGRSYYWYAGNQINITQGGYSGKPLHGVYQDFYMNKNLKESGMFAGGLKTGSWKSWTMEGVLKEESYFQKGQKNGAYLQYDSLGKVVEKGFYQHDQLSGKQEKLIGDSTVIVHYKKGKVVPGESILPGFIKKLLPKKANPQNLNPQKINP